MDILPDDAPAPRLCHLIKWPDFDGYGFNLHAERSNPGQFIGKIDDESPAQMAGLREGDRIIEVNGVNISNENHRQVVERIKSNPNETKILVVDPEGDNWYKEQNIVVKSSQINVVYIKTPVPRPQPDSPRAKFHNSHQNKSSNSTSYAGPSESSLSPSTLNSSSLEPSEINDDSIEQRSASHSNGVSPPMSPDSGKGDEDPTIPVSPVNSKEDVIVEAEINKQSSPVTQSSKQDNSTELKALPSQSSDQDHEIQAKNIQPDSLNETTSQTKSQDQSRKTSNASGKTASSQEESILKKVSNFFFNSIQVKVERILISFVWLHVHDELIFARTRAPLIDTHLRFKPKPSTVCFV